jgi:hypothetical protein
MSDFISLICWAVITSADACVPQYRLWRRTNLPSACLDATWHKLFLTSPTNMTWHFQLFCVRQLCPTDMLSFHAFFILR